MKNTAAQKLKQDPNQAAIVTAIFNDVLNGKGLTEIVKDLNRRGIPGPNGKGWGKTGLHRILTNEIYTGVFVWGRNSKRGLEPVRAENVCTPIVEKDTFIKVHNLLGERAPSWIHPKRVASPFLLSGLAHCGYCGKALVGKYAKGGKFSYYVCNTLEKKGAGSCKARYLNAAKLEAIIIGKIREYILTNENLMSLAQLVNDEMDSTMKQYQDELNLIWDTYSDINERLERLYEAIETGKIGLDDLVPRIKELRKRQESLNSRRIEIENLLADRRVDLADLETITNYVSDLHNLLNEGSLTERRAFIRSFVKEVKVTGHEAVLIYTIPVPPETTVVGKAGVLPTVHYGGPSDPIAQPKIKTFFELSLVPADYSTININPQK